MHSRESTLSSRRAVVEAHKYILCRFNADDRNEILLVRFEIVKVFNGGFYLLIDIHHLVTDGASIDIFMYQLCAKLDGQEIDPEEYNYYDCATDKHSRTEQMTFSPDVWHFQTKLHRSFRTFTVRISLTLKNP